METPALRIIETLRRNGYEAYFAGGCVRDRLRGVPAKDYDIASSAPPEKIQELFPKTVPVGAQFGVILVIEEGIPFEVATFRKEGRYLDGRRPTEVSFATLAEDAHRRDFTVNGLYFDPLKNEVIDLVGGRNDLALKVIRTIGDAEQRFLEDHLRLLRAVRFAVQLDFEIDRATFHAVTAHAGLITKVSQERIRDELTRILTSRNPARGIRLLDEAGLLRHILPEMETMKGVEQPSEYHPEGDVFIHTLMLLEGLSEAPIELAMGCLLHDVAKPATFVRAVDRIRFHGHDKLGAEMSREICKRLAFSNQQTDLICELVAEHLKFKDAFQMKVSTLKRFFALDRFDLHMELHKRDCLASHGNLDAYEFCKRKLEEFGAAPPPPSNLVTGEDLIQLGFRPGPSFSKMLRAVEDAVLEGTVKTKEEGLRFITDNFTVERLRNLMTSGDLVQKFLKGDLRAFSRLISLAENKDPSIAVALSSIYPKVGRAKVIGITGPPGAGKSSLTSFFIRFVREQGKKVCVVAVDPVSPFTGGALLGDRIRLVDHFNDEGVFIRSLSTRGKLGGLSLATRQVTHLADAFGFDYVIVETVGVGQSEVDVRKLADLSLVVLVPEWGDAIQTLKAGLLEIGDLFVVNKSDREGADRLVQDLKSMLQMAHKPDTSVLASSTRDEASVRVLFDKMNAFFDDKAEFIKGRRSQSIKETVYELLESLVLEEARAWVDGNVSGGETNPYRFLDGFLKQHPSGKLFG